MGRARRTCDVAVVAAGKVCYMSAHAQFQDFRRILADRDCNQLVVMFDPALYSTCMMTSDEQCSPWKVLEG